MKTVSSLLLLLGVSSASAFLEKRQGYLDALNSVGPAGIAAMGSVPKVAGIDRLKPEVREDAIHQIAKLGPISLAGGNNGKEQNKIWKVVDGICHNCTILKGKIGVQFTDGSVADVSKGIYIHHVLSWDLQKKTNAFVTGCDTSTPMLTTSAKFMGTGDDQANVPVWYSTRDGKTGGYYVGANDQFPMWLDLVNYNKETKNIYVTIELEYLKGKQSINTRDALLSVDNCKKMGGIRVSNTGPTNTTSGKWTFLDDGTIVFAKGHLHNGGVRMVMYINGKQVCESVASYGSAGQALKESISGMSICPEPIKVKKGDKLSMTAMYDASKHAVRKGGGGMPDIMGMFAISFSGGSG